MGLAHPGVAPIDRNVCNAPLAASTAVGANSRMGRTFQPRPALFSANLGAEEEPMPNPKSANGPRGPRARATKTKIPEAGEQRLVVRALRRLEIASKGRIRYFAVPNGGSRQRLEGARLKAGGVVAGVPDLLIVGSMPTPGVEPFSRQELALIRVGTQHEPPDSLVRRFLATLDAGRITALEMKHGEATERAVSPEQRKWLDFFASLPGGSGLVGFGEEDALDKLVAVGGPARVKTPWVDEAVGSFECQSQGRGGVVEAPVASTRWGRVGLSDGGLPAALSAATP